MDPIHLLKSMLASMAASLGTMYAPEFYLPGRPLASHHPPSAEVLPDTDADRRPMLLWPQQRTGSAA